jgi:endonuclease-3
MPRANEIYRSLQAMYPEVRCELDYQNHFQLLIAVVLSAQTTDASVNKVTPALFRRYPDAEALGKAEFSAVHELIRTIGLANTKARNIIALSQRLAAEKNGIVPADFSYLISLPGVGRKSANVIMGEAFRIPALPVDTHVLRVAQRLGLSENDRPEKVEQDIGALYPEEDWYGLHLRLIHFGRYFCRAKNPDCPLCPFTGFCHYYTKNHPQA